MPVVGSSKGKEAILEGGFGALALGFRVLGDTVEVSASALCGFPWGSTSEFNHIGPLNPTP